MHVQLELTDAPAALPRLVSTLHGKGYAVAHLRLEGTRCCLSVEGHPRLLALLDRQVDVLHAHHSQSCVTRQVVPLPTTYLVTRQAV